MAHFQAAIASGTPEAGKLGFAVLLALLIYVVRRRYRHFIVLPAAVLCASFAARMLNGIGLFGASESWFLYVPQAAGVTPPALAPARMLAALPSLMDHVGEIVAVAVATAMAIILNTSGLEAV